jgi:hypothetical protein
MMVHIHLLSFTCALLAADLILIGPTRLLLK